MRLRNERFNCRWHRLYILFYTRSEMDTNSSRALHSRTYLEFGGRDQPALQDFWSRAAKGPTLRTKGGLLLSLPNNQKLMVSASGFVSPHSVTAESIRLLRCNVDALRRISGNEPNNKGPNNAGGNWKIESTNCICASDMTAGLGLESCSRRAEATHRRGGGRVEGDVRRDEDCYLSFP